MEPALSILLHGVTEETAQRWQRAAEKSTGRSVEARVTSSEVGLSPGALRNGAIRASRGRFIVLVSDVEPPRSSFLQHALRTLERDPSVSFVASWHDGVPSCRDRPAKRLLPADLLARPWFAHVATLFRRELWEALGGFDEELWGMEDLEFWLRAHSHGSVGHVIEEPGLSGGPFGTSLRHDHPDAEREARRVFERHSSLFAAHWQEVVLGKERIVRELFALSSATEGRAIALRQEEARLSALLARSPEHGS